MSDTEAPPSRWHARLIVVALLATVALRGWGLGAKSFWLDEAFSVARAKYDLWRPFWEHARRDNHPFLYYLLLHFVMKVGQGDAALRSLSLVASLLATLGTCTLAREALGSRASVWATALFGASAYQLYFAQEARPYALATAFAAGSCWMWVRMWKRGFTAPRLVAYGLCSVLAVYSFYYSGLLLVAHAVHAAMEWKRIREFGWKLALTWASAAALIALLLVHLRYLAQLTGLGSRKPGVMDLPSLGQAAREHVFGYLWLPEEQEGVLIALTIVAGVVVVGACVWACRSDGFAARALVPVIAVPLGLLLLYRAPVRFESKHLAIVAPVLWTLVASVGRKRGSGDIALSLLLVGNLASCGYYHSDRFVKEDWRGLAGFADAEFRAGDTVVFSPFYLQDPFERYFTRRPYDFVRVTNPSVEREADPTYWVLGEGLYVVEPSGAHRAIVPWKERTGRYWLVEGQSKTIPFTPAIAVALANRHECVGLLQRTGMDESVIRVSLWEPRGE